MQRNTLDIVHDDAYLLRRLNEVMHPDDVGMVDLLERHYLSLHGLALHAVVKLRLLINLDGILLHAALVVTGVNHSVGALTDWLSDLVRVEGTAAGNLRR